jgi:hypothetical protein
VERYENKFFNRLNFNEIFTIKAKTGDNKGKAIIYEGVYANFYE